MGLQAPHTDFQTTHAHCPRARFAGCSYQMGNSFARFTVYDIASCIQSDPKFFVQVDFIVA
jgi:hypothetical protein